MAVEQHLDTWLAELERRGGTDILLTAGSAPLLRVDGRLEPLAGAPALASDEIEAITLGQLPPDHLKGALQPGRELDFSFSWRDQGRVRANVFYQRGQCSLSLRYIPMRIPSPEELGLPPAVVASLRSPSGLILVTGPTGSGKSTSMASMIDAVNRSRPCHIITIEDPIEYLHSNHLAAVSQREVGIDTGSFASALRSVLREDPDVVLVGEMRDLESIAACLTIAETGHLVIATLHTNDSGQALDRIIDVFPAERRPQIQVQLAGTLLAVLYQRLLPKPYGGMVAAYELMLGTPAVRNLVREGKTRQLRNTIVMHRGEGMQTLENCLSELVAAGVVDYEVAVEASLYPKDIPKPTPATPSQIASAGQPALATAAVTGGAVTGGAANGWAANGGGTNGGGANGWGANGGGATGGGANGWGANGGGADGANGAIGAIGAIGGGEH
jgi:twitching motility protein PilT